MILVVVGGCAPSVVIKDQEVIKGGLYKVDTLSNAWVRIPSGSDIIDERSSLTRDIIYLRCPGQQVAQIARANYLGPGLKNGRPSFEARSFEELVVGFFTDNRAVLRTTIKELLSHRTVQLGEHKAVELEYISQAKPLGFCTTAEEISGSIKAKAIVIDNGKSLKPLSGGWFKRMIILSYAGPPETYDEAVEEFDQMVQSFRLIKD